MKSSTLLFLLIFVLRTVFAQDKDLFFVSIHSNLHYVIRNPEGKQSGFNPYANHKFREINESYGVFNVDSEDPEIDPPQPVNEFMDDNPISGEYLLTLYGIAPTSYETFIAMSRSVRDGDRIDIIGVIDSNQTVKYLLKYDRAPGAPYVVEKVIEAGTLRRDLDNCYKLDLLGRRPLYLKLGHRVDQYEKWIKKREKKKARKELEKFEKELDEVFEKSKRESKRPNHFIKEEAYRILKEDVRGVVEYLSR